MTLYLFFDTETTGLINFKTDLANPSQPDMVQFAAKVVDDSGKVLAALSTLVYPKLYAEIPERAAQVHGITPDLAKKFGILPDAVLEWLEFWMDRVDFFVCHNWQYDSKIVEITSRKLNRKNPMEYRPWICTMTHSEVIKLCALPKKTGGYKWPKLTELHEYLFGRSFHGAHDALADISATVRCFFELRKRGIL